MNASNKKTYSHEDILKLIPIKNRQYVHRNPKEIDILVPRFKISFLQNLLPEGRKYILANLDEIGSYTWELIDGKNNIKEIIFNVREKFGQEVEPAAERVTLFLQKMHSNNFIIF